MPRGVYERKKTVQLAEKTKPMDKHLMGLLAIRGYLLAIAMAGAEPTAQDFQRIHEIVDEALKDTDNGEN